MVLKLCSRQMLGSQTILLFWEKALKQVDEDVLNATVEGFVNQHGVWDMEKLHSWLPNDVCDHIRALVPPLGFEF